MNTRVCCAIPNNGQIRTRTVFALTRMIKSLSVPYDVLTHESCYIHVNRERLAQRAIEGGYSHILFLDSDMYFEKDALERLLARDKDIVGADYNYRELPLRGIMKTEDREGNTINMDYPDGLKKCAALGTGFLLIKTSVFDKLTHPWFFYESDENGETIQGDDIWFCNKALKAGFDIWCDTTIKIYHLGEYLF